jgi:hypothetical protein
VADAPSESIAAVIEEAEAAGFRVELRDGVPMIPEVELRGGYRMQKALEFVERAATVTGARVFREGIVLEPPRPAKVERSSGFPDPVGADDQL